MIDWNEAYKNSDYIEDAQKYPRRWAEEAEAFRMRVGINAVVDQPYGDHPREHYDIFYPPAAAKGVFIFVHGGYWRDFDRSSWSHFTEGALERGYLGVVPSYPLAPYANLSAILDAVVRLVTKVADEQTGPIILAGHSAGGQLVSRMACEGVLPERVAARIAKVAPISGIFDLRPLIDTDMNDELRIDRARAAAESPIFHLPILAPMTVIVGEDERPEFLRQSALITNIWSGYTSISSIKVTNAHHFNVIDTLRDGNTEVMRDIFDFV